MLVTKEVMPEKWFRSVYFKEGGSRICSSHVYCPLSPFLKETAQDTLDQFAFAREHSVFCSPSLSSLRGEQEEKVFRG